MNALYPPDIIRIWELTSAMPLWHRALVMLAATLPDTSINELALLSIGQRNAYLYQIRQQLFGNTIEGLTACPDCGEQLEFTMDVASILEVHPEPQPQYKVTIDTYDIVFRLLNTADLVQAQTVGSLAAARQKLLADCMVTLHKDGQAITPDALPQAVIAEFGDYLWECDPLTDLQLQVQCADCGTQWSPSLDIVSYLWTEIEWQAKLLLDEVHRIAQEYGWSEETILNLSSERRKCYINKLS